MKQKYSPDILNCLANLSSDEVFTSPELANRMLDLLPQELFQNPKTRFLDPCSKSGVFLREITKRLLVGLEGQIPDLQERIDHVMTKQVFGIACTDLTAEMSRRTLYCSKQANGEYSVSTAFQDGQGNLLYERCHHTWNAQGRCEHCGASKGEYHRSDSRETYAYPFIHKSIKEIFHKNMQFDVIIGNPPYQMSDGGGTGSSAMPIYHKFVLQAQKLNPRFLCMIIPARWYSGGKGLDEFRNTMLNDFRIKDLVDYVDSRECFPSVDIAGGVCYFLWNRDYYGLCTVNTIRKNSSTIVERKLNEFDTFIRENTSIQIIRKVLQRQEKMMDSIVFSRNPFGFASNASYSAIEKKGSIPIMTSKGYFYVSRESVTSNEQCIGKWKVVMSKASSEHAGQTDKDGRKKVLSKVEVLPPNTICSESYLLISVFDDEHKAENLKDYAKTNFFRFLLSTILLTQNIAKDKFQFVPLQDFSHPWTDEMLYKKYGLTEDEIAFIESMIRPME